MQIQAIPSQPHPLVSYLRVGRLLYYSLSLFLLESWGFGYLFQTALEEQHPWWLTGFWFYCFMFSFLHIFLVMADGWSRYQNYKRAKDLFYQHGYRDRIARLYIASKCQRNAAIEAARELGIKQEVVDYYRSIGVRWYHYIPYFMIKDPLFFLKSHFWNRTFLEKNYTPKFDYQKLQATLAT